MVNDEAAGAIAVASNFAQRRARAVGRLSKSAYRVVSCASRKTFSLSTVATSASTGGVAGSPVER